MENKEIFYTPCGENIIPTYEKQIINGIPELVKTGTKNIYDEIQVSKDECDIHKIMERCACGDFSGLRGDQPIYGDFSEANKSLNELNEIQKTAQSNYDKLTEAEKEIVDKYLKGEKEQAKAEQEKTEKTEQKETL